MRFRELLFGLRSQLSSPTRRDTSEWCHKLYERDNFLDKLEIAEANYIKSFRLVPTSSNGRRLEYVEPHGPTDYVAPRGELASPVLAHSSCRSDYYKLSTGRRPSGSHEHLNVPIPEPPPPLEPPKSRNPLSRFVEVNRDSSLFSKRFSIGQRIKVNEQGQYVADPSPESEHTNPTRIQYLSRWPPGCCRICVIARGAYSSDGGRTLRLVYLHPGHRCLATLQIAQEAPLRLVSSLLPDPAGRVEHHNSKLDPLAGSTFKMLQSCIVAQNDGQRFSNPLPWLLLRHNGPRTSRRRL